MPDGYDPDAILADADAHPTHKRYAEINVGIRDRGERWSKCVNCGEPYQLAPGWNDSMVCSVSCDREFADDLAGGGAL